MVCRLIQRPQPTEPTKRLVRKEAFFGCVICGNPIIEYAHIIPYSKSQDNSAKNLVVLCPNHHTRYDLGDISEQKIRLFKANPFNKGKDVTDRFDIEGEIPTIQAGSNIFRNVPVLLAIDNKNIITLNKMECLMLNVEFYDEKNNLLAFIKDNEWCALSGMVWDIEYHTVAKALIIRTKPRKILLRLRISQGVVHLSGLLYYNGFRVKIFPNYILFGNEMMIWKGCRFENLITALWIVTQTHEFKIGTFLHAHEYKKPILATLMRRSNFLHGRIYETHYIMKECKFCGKIVL